jgi:hypothetical protein
MAALFGIRSEQPKSLIPCIKVSANIDTYLTSFTIHLNMSSVFVPSTTAAARGAQVAGTSARWIEKVKGQGRIS